MTSEPTVNDGANTGSIADLLTGPPVAALNALESRARRVVFDDHCLEDVREPRSPSLRHFDREYGDEVQTTSIIQRMLTLMRNNPDRVYSSACFRTQGISLNTAAQTLTRLAKQKLIEPVPCPPNVAPQPGGRPKRYYCIAKPGPR